MKQSKIGGIVFQNIFCVHFGRVPPNSRFNCQKITSGGEFLVHQGFPAY